MTITSPQLGALLRAALADDGPAAASWSVIERQLDLDSLSGDDYDAVCLVGSRVARLPAMNDRARLAGLARHAWALNQSSFATALAGASAARPVLSGRWATLAHLPAGWVLPAGAPSLGACGTNPTVERTLGGFAVAVPPVEAHLVACLISRRWVDASCLLALDPSPDQVAAEAARVRRRVAVKEGLEGLVALLGPSMATADRIPQLHVGLLRAARERFWTASFAMASSLRVRRQASRSE